MQIESKIHSCPVQELKENPLNEVQEKNVCLSVLVAVSLIDTWKRKNIIGTVRVEFPHLDCEVSIR